VPLTGCEVVAAWCARKGHQHTAQKHARVQMSPRIGLTGPIGSDLHVDSTSGDGRC